MKDIIEFLNKNKFGGLATSTNQKPDLRPFELVCICDTNLFFYVSADSDLSSQLKNNQDICFCATDENYNYVKVSGKVEFSDKQEDKKMILENSKFAKDNFNESNWDKMEVFYLAHGTAKYHLHNEAKTMDATF